MNLPVGDLESALAFYETKMGFHIVSRADRPHKCAVLARDAVQIGLAENGGDASQDGCAFHVTNLDALFDEFNSNGLKLSAIETEGQGEETWRVFYVVAPDGLCYWLGEKKS